MRRQKHPDQALLRSAPLPESQDTQAPDDTRPHRDTGTHDATGAHGAGAFDDAGAYDDTGAYDGVGAYDVEAYGVEVYDDAAEIDPDLIDLEQAALRVIAQQLTDDPHEVMRQVREARRERVKESRDATRQAREAERAMNRQAREVEREVARHLRHDRGEARGDRETVGPDTRTRIQQVALELFTEHGYEATSLREIAESLGVTKAALYYHFRTKDDIIESLVQDRMNLLSELIAWASAQPRGAATRREALRRYSTMLNEQGHHGLMRFFERNQSSMTQHRSGVAMRALMIEMLDVLSDQDAPLQDQIRCSLAIFALHSTWFTIRDPGVTEQQRREAALEVALDLIDRHQARPGPATG